MDLQVVEERVARIRAKLDSIKSLGAVVIYSIILDSELKEMGEEGVAVAKEVAPYLEEAITGFNKDPNTSLYHSSIGGTA